MILFKMCPRCKTGTILIDRDYYSWNMLCLQCGYMRDVEGPQEAVALLERMERDAKKVGVPA